MFLFDREGRTYPAWLATVTVVGENEVVVLTDIDVSVAVLVAVLVAVVVGAISLVIVVVNIAVE